MPGLVGKPGIVGLQVRICEGLEVIIDKFGKLSSFFKYVLNIYVRYMYLYTYVFFIIHQIKFQNHMLSME